MRITDLLNKKNIILNTTSETKDELITELTTLLMQNDHIQNANKLKSEIIEREKIMSTGIGKGIGLPHCKTDAVDDIIIAVARNKKGISNYETIDDETVKIVFLLISPADKPNDHINMLARISRILKLDFVRNSLLSATSVKKFLEIIKTEERKFL